MPSKRRQNDAEMVIYIFCILFTAVVARLIARKLNSIFPDCICSLVNGMFIGVFLKSMWKEKQFMFRTYIITFFKHVYMPLLLFKTSFFVDYSAFNKSLSQILVIVLCVVPTSFLFMGSVMRLVIDPTWHLSNIFYFGTISIVVYTGQVVSLLESSSYLTKHVITLLEGETLFGIVLATTIHKIVQMCKEGIVKYWYQIVTVCIRRFLGSTIGGCICGFFGVRIIRLFYNDPALLMVCTVALTFVAQYIEAEQFNGMFFAIMVMGALMSQEKTFLAPRIIAFLLNIWKLVAFCCNVMILTYSGAHITMSSIYFEWHYYDILFVFLTFILDCTGRSLGFLIFSPILSRLGYGLSYTNRTICIWSGIKNPMNIGFALYFFKHFCFTKKSEIYFFHAIMLIILSNLMLGFLPKWFKMLGVTDPPLSSKINMHNCMRYLKRTREREMCLLRHNPTYSDTNWSEVVKATEIAHPYENVDGTIEASLNERVAQCPNCLTQVVNDKTDKEVADLTQAAKIQVLKAKKVQYMQLYEQHLISKQVLRTLIHAVEMALESNELITNASFYIDICKPETRFERKIRSSLQTFNASTNTRIYPPKQWLKKKCFNISNNSTFEFVILAIILVDTSFIVAIQIDEALPSFNLFNIRSVFRPIISGVFFLLYLLEFICKVLGLSAISMKEGLVLYFFSIWNCMDFFILVLLLFLLIAELIYVFALTQFVLFGWTVYLVTSIVTSCRLIRLLKLIRVVHKCMYIIMRAIDWSFDETTIYNICVMETYCHVERELVNALPFIVDDKDIQTALIEIINRERLLVVKFLIKIRKERPDLAIINKTKQAITTILNSMRYSMTELKNLGWLEPIQFEAFKKLIMEKYKDVASKKMIGVPPSAASLFREIVWIDNRIDIADYLFEHVIMHTYSPGDQLCEVGQQLDGIYLIITGAFCISYVPNDKCLERLTKYGTLPIIDFLTVRNYTDACLDFLITGATLGEMAVLTGRPVNYNVFCEDYSQVYILKKEFLTKAMEMDSNPVNGLECRLWKTIGTRIGLSVLSTIPTYSLLRTQKIHFALERSFMPNLSGYKVFTINNLIRNVILVEGVAMDHHTKEIHVAPKFLPMYIKKLLINNKVSNNNTYVQTKLFIIPEMNVQIKEIMEQQKKKEIVDNQITSLGSVL